MMRRITGTWAPQAVRAAADLGLTDVLAYGPHKRRPRSSRWPSWYVLVGCPTSKDTSRCEIVRDRAGS
ncbi:hypothetical protein OHA25_38850 [Nonomuraea sp. NBC_00507]|uniref:hypothetical protein n=1 Tax=Nonomuraea sp. NBC_00507 TaxID=2976002 RepID=UPI002E185ADB